MSNIKAWVVQCGLVTPDEAEGLARMARARQEPLWESLFRENKITESWLADMFSKQLKIPLIDLHVQSIDSDAADRVPERLARKYLCMPFAWEGRKLRVAFVDPSNLEGIHALEFFTGRKVLPAVALRSRVLESIADHFSQVQALDVIDRAGDGLGLQFVAPRDEMDLGDGTALHEAQLPPIVKLVNLVITEALRVRASDVHIETSERDVRIRLRVDGVLRDFLQAPAWLQSGLIARLKVVAKLDIAEKRVPQDGRFRVRLGSNVSDVRLSTLPTQYGEKAVLRVLGSSEGIPELTGLGIPAGVMGKLVEAVMQPQGMVIVTGPTGSGKSTTLYSLLGRRRSAEVNIVTVEDPIEYQLEGVTQVQVNINAGLTFASCLRSILRQDPDVILVGEIRDRETAEIAFHAAMTGHLVLSTLHTNNSIATITRLLDLGIDPFAVTTSVTAIIAQRLARKVCEKCREPYRPSQLVLEKLRWDDHEFQFTRGKGCGECHNSGFKGRVGIYEMLRMTSAVRTAINKRSSEEEILKAATASGFVALLDEACDKIRAGLTTPDEILRVIQLMDEEEQRRCPKCSRPIPLESGKCVHCSEVSPLTCLGCGLDLDPTWRVCPRCGNGVHSQRPKGESPLAPTLPGDPKLLGKGRVQ